MEFCSFCYFKDIDLESCSCCKNLYCKKCQSEWYIMIKLNKCKSFNIGYDYCNYNCCIKCIYKNKPIPIFNKSYEIEYEIQWYEKECILELKEFSFNLHDLDLSILKFVYMCKRLDKFNIFSKFTKEYNITFNQLINYYRVLEYKDFKKLINIFRVKYDLNIKAENKVELMCRCKTFLKSLIEFIENKKY